MLRYAIAGGNGNCTCIKFSGLRCELLRATSPGFIAPIGGTKQNGFFNGCHLCFNGETKAKKKTKKAHTAHLYIHPE